MATTKNTQKAITQSNKILNGIDNVSDKTTKSSKTVQRKATVKTIDINGSTTPYRASSLVAADVDKNLQTVISSFDNSFEDFVKASQRYLASNFAINLTKENLAEISRKGSKIVDELTANTDILNSDIQNILTQNLATGVSQKKLTLELQELYPAYSKNASTIVRTGLSRLFNDINVTKFKESDFNWYIWAGPKDSKNRELPCRHWVRHRFPASQLSTISATRATLWNCRHNIIPIPDSEIESYQIGDISFA